MKTNTTEIRCLLFRAPDEGNRWCAVALDMDVWGFGSSKEEARGDLEELIDTQIEFATGRNEIEILNHPAEQKWLDLWDELEKLGKETIVGQSYAVRDDPITIDERKHITCLFHEAA